MNAHVNQDSDSVTVEKAELRPVEVDVSDCPDLFPAVCALPAVTDGVSKITDMRRLRIKESNRVLAMRLGLKELGIRTVEPEDSLVVHGGKPRKAILNPHHDHRIAMAFALLGLCTNELTIVDAECISKSYPSFWSDLESLGAEVTVN
jgi:3-phosphoshikimate 1-carboxyvinyltransferase